MNNDNKNIKDNKDDKCNKNDEYDSGYKDKDLGNKEKGRI